MFHGLNGGGDERTLFETVEFEDLIVNLAESWERLGRVSTDVIRV